jgi:NitT/TauT family transport system substrate-binding protein
MVIVTSILKSMASLNFVGLTRFTALALLASLSVTLSAHAGTAIHFTLDRKIDGTAAPTFLAIDKGYFNDEGLDVTIDVTPGGPPEVFSRLAAGKADLAISDLNLLIRFRDQGGVHRV